MERCKACLWERADAEQERLQCSLFEQGIETTLPSVYSVLGPKPAHTCDKGGVESCVFCPDNWPNLDIVERPMEGFGAGPWAIINPLNPVTEGHVLVISSQHTKDASDRPFVAGDAVTVAGNYIHRHGLQANIITSIGPLATQTVMHTHVHIVPRTLNDDLPLPWTPQQMDQERWRRALQKKFETINGIVTTKSDL